MSTEYSAHKIIHQADKLTDLRNNYQVVPLQIHLVPTNRCNHRCIGCAYRMKGYSSNQTFNPSDQLTKDQALSIIDSAAALRVKAVQVTGGGEPTMHPDIAAILDRILRQGMDLALVTNGTNLKDCIPYLKQAKWVRVSLDAATPETYSQRRGLSDGETDFLQVIENIELLCQNKTSDTKIGIGYVMYRDNWSEVYAATKLAKELGVDNIRISAAFTTAGYDYFNGILDKAKDAAKKAELKFNSRDFTVFNLFDDRIRDNYEGVQDYDYCPIKELQVYVGADANVYTCCTLAYNQRGLIGSLKNKTFAELWLSPEKFELYNAHNPKVLCRLPCMYKQKNKFINYCLDKDPKHINFI